MVDICHGGPLAGKPMPRDCDDVMKATLIQLDDETRHVYAFQSTSMTDGFYVYVGPVGDQGDDFEPPAPPQEAQPSGITEALAVEIMKLRREVEKIKAQLPPVVDQAQDDRING